MTPRAMTASIPTPNRCRPMIARAYRLREDADVRRVRSRGRAFAFGPLVARVLPNDLDPAQNRYTVIAGKKCGKAVDRNRLKRLTREALRGYHPHLKPGHDIAIVVRGERRRNANPDRCPGHPGAHFPKAGLVRPRGRARRSRNRAIR